MERVIADSYYKGRKHTIGDDLASEFNQRVLAVNRLYGYLYDKGILKETAFVYRDLPHETHFALDAKCLEPYRTALKKCGIEGAELAIRHIFDESYTPCVYSGAIQPGWLMMTYRDVDGCVSRSWECDHVKWLNNHAAQEVYAVKEKDGVKAAVRKMFSCYNWPEQSVERTWICAYRDVLGKAGEGDNLTDICVPTDWLMDTLKENGISTEDWFDEYTADDTQEIARKAMVESVILDCSDPELRSRLIEKGAMEQNEKPVLFAVIEKAEMQRPKTKGARMPSGKDTEPER